MREMEDMAGGVMAKLIFFKLPFGTGTFFLLSACRTTIMFCFSVLIL